MRLNMSGVLIIAAECVILTFRKFHSEVYNEGYQA